MQFSSLGPCTVYIVIHRQLSIRLYTLLCTLFRRDRLLSLHKFVTRLLISAAKHSSTFHLKHLYFKKQSLYCTCANSNCRGHSWHL